MIDIFIVINFNVMKYDSFKLDLEKLGERFLSHNQKTIENNLTAFK
jgi:hypothetical protein